MAKRTTAFTVVLVRAGQRVKIPAGRTVDLTAEEIEDINKTDPNALVKIVAGNEPLPEFVLPQEKAKVAPADAKLATTQGTTKANALTKDDSKSKTDGLPASTLKDDKEEL